MESRIFESYENEQFLPTIKQADGNDEFHNRGFKINGQRLKFDNHFVSVCETTIEQILFIAI